MPRGPGPPGRRSRRLAAASALAACVLSPLGGCRGPSPGSAAATPAGPFLVVLGTAQDAGWPQAGCRKACCEGAWRGDGGGLVASVALVDPRTGRRWLFDATPDLPRQLRHLDALAPTGAPPPGLDGIFLTHAHIGHYTGLVHVGHEVMGARDVPVYAMPRLGAFLASDGPWDQLVRYENIRLRELRDGVAVELGDGLRVVPFEVPHRDEYSETVGFRVEGPERSAVFLPDIDKWDRWEVPVETVLADVDRAWLDGTFFDGDELPGRAMDEIPHPFIAESLERFAALPAPERAKVRFIHLNHTNPALREDSPERRRIREAGLGVAREGRIFPL